MRRNVIAAALLGALAALPAAAQEAFPSRPIRFVVPFAAGGPSDIVARIMAPRMQQTLGQPVVVDNRPGAGGVTGVDVVAKAPGDGYVFGIGSAGALAISPNGAPIWAMPKGPGFMPTKTTRLRPAPKRSR